MFDEGNGRDFDTTMRSALRNALKGTKEAHAFNYLASIFVNDAVLAVSRLVDKQMKDRACFDKLLHLWGRDDFKAAIMERNIRQLTKTRV